MHRRDALRLAASAMALSEPCAATAYDALPTAAAPDPAELAAARAKARKEREAKAAKKNAEVATLTDAVTSSKDAAEFTDALDALSLWIIAQGKPLPPPGGPWADILQASPLPEGFKTRELVKSVKEKLASLPQIAYACEMTRDNKGICFWAGPQAEGAYKAFLVELKKRAPLQYDTPYGPVNF